MALNNEVGYHPMDPVIEGLKKVDLSRIVDFRSKIEVVGDLRIRTDLCDNLILDSQERNLLMIDGNHIPVLEQVKADYPTIISDELLMAALRSQQEAVLDILKKEGFPKHDGPGEGFEIDVVVYINPDGSLSSGYWGTVNPSPRFSFEIMSDFEDNGFLSLHASFGELVVRYCVEYDAYEDMTDERFERLFYKLISGGLNKDDGSSRPWCR